MTTDHDATDAVIHIMTGAWRAQSLYTAVRLGIPDLIEQGHKTAASIATATGASEQSTVRLMRLLTHLGVFTGHPTKRYQNTPVSRALLHDQGGLRDLCLLYGEEFYQAWSHAHDSISGQQDGFHMAFGQPLYSYLGEHPHLSSRFQRTMNSGSMFFDAVPKRFDFAGLQVVDVGGGGGQLLATILKAHPTAHGTLFDRDHMLPKARRHLQAEVGLERVELVAGDMFKSLPAGGDVYLFSRVLAGWDDEAVTTAFTNCRQAINQEHGQLLVLDRFLTDDGTDYRASLWDIHLLVTTGGRLRSVNEIHQLMTQAGFAPGAAKHLTMGASAITGRPRSA